MAVDKIKGLDRDYSMERFYSAIGGSRQSVHKSKLQKAKQNLLESQATALALEWRQSHPRMGSRTMYKSLQSRGMEIPLGITAFEKLLSRKGLTVGKVKRFIPKTSDGLGQRVYPNLINGLELNNTGQLLVGDITFYWLLGRWCYLFVLKDVYSQRLVSPYPSEDMKKESAMAALRQGVKANSHIDWYGCIHHTDNGSQYDAGLYRELLRSNHMAISRAKNCQQNGASEQMNHIIKNMYLKPMYPQNMTQMRSYCKLVTKRVNEERAIAQLGYKTVTEFERMIAEMKPEKRPIKLLHDFNASG